MDVPANVLEALKCTKCNVYLSRGPIYLQLDGAALCGLCFTPESKATRNTHYEALAQLAAFPCKYHDLGCEERVPFTQGDAAIPHEEVCEHRAWVCPVLGSTGCDWLGPKSGLLQHCEDQHADLVLHSPCAVEHDISNSNEKTYLLRWIQLLFLLHVKVCVASGKIYHSVRYEGRSDEAKEFIYKLQIKRDNALLSKDCDVAPQSCLTPQEATSLALDINGLLTVLGGFDGATFTAEIRRVLEVAMCAVCGAPGAVLVYRDARGWMCSRCAPARRACQNKGCDYQDFIRKCESHETFFCRHRGWLLRKTINLMCLKVGPIWRVTPTKRVHAYWVCTAAGAVNCKYSPLDDGFDLQVFTPMTSERLREFRCVVRVTQPVTGVVRIHTPDVVFDQDYDWHVCVKKTDFPSWDGVLDLLDNR